MSLVWTEEDWASLDERTRTAALRAGSDAAAWPGIVRSARCVLRTFSTSFFLVTRFLPPAKRARVEVIYATVRYPDEVVDSFPLGAEDRLARLDRWEASYDRALDAPSMTAAIASDVPCVLAAFAHLVRERSIPPRHYRDFLLSMRRDARPAPFDTLDDLIDGYVYGSAIVVGILLSHVYGAPPGVDFRRTLAAARDLGIALQLTNFLRDVPEDLRRGRLYLPLSLLRAEGIDDADVARPDRAGRLLRVIASMAAVAEEHYARAERGLDTFSPDCRTAIRACIDVYRKLNRLIATSRAPAGRRQSVPAAEKFRVLPASKYWRLPLAYLLR